MTRKTMRGGDPGADTGMFVAELEANKSAPGSARAVVARLTSRIPTRLLADLELIVSELVTNSAKYGSGRRIRVELCLGSGEIRGLVRDRTATDAPIDLPASLPTPGADRAGRWGLSLVDNLTDSWGVDASGCSVWFRIQAPERIG